MLIKIGLLVVFFIITIAIGAYYRKQSTDVSSFLLGGRNVGAWLSAFSYGTSYFSAVIFVGYAGQFGWKHGLSAVWIGVGNALVGSLLAWLVLANRTRIMTKHLNSTTMPNFFGKRYNSNILKVLASVVCFVFLIPYTASLFNGLSRIFTMAFGIDYMWCVIGMALLTAIYVVIGGYMATAVNDFIQGIIVLGGIVAVIIAVLNDKGGFTEAIRSLSAVTDDGGQFTTVFGPDFVNLLGVILLTSMGAWGLPQMVSRFYAIKSKAAIKKGTVISTVFAGIIAGGCYFLGSFGRLYSDEVERIDGKVVFDSIVPTMLSKMPDILIGVVVVLIFAASISTLSALVLASGSTITLDFIQPVRKKEFTEKGKISVMRIFIAVFVVISSILAIVQAKSTVTFIAQLMGISWGALAGAFFAPFLLGLFWKRVTKTAVIVNVIAAPCLMIANMLFGQYLPPEFGFFSSSINCGVLVMMLGFVIVPVVSLLTKKPDEKKVDEIFSCYAEAKNAE